LEAAFGEKYLAYCLYMAQRYMEDGKLEKEGGYLRVTQKGIFVSDGIMIDLLCVKK
jgi:oxygen-independent coproporphyrinogen-3 oxidase